MFEIHVNAFLKNFRFFGHPLTSLRANGSLAKHEWFGHVPPNRSAEPFGVSEVLTTYKSPLTSINIGIISRDIFIRAFGSLTVLVSIILLMLSSNRGHARLQ